MLIFKHICAPHLLYKIPVNRGNDKILCKNLIKVVAIGEEKCHNIGHRKGEAKMKRISLLILLGSIAIAGCGSVETMNTVETQESIIETVTEVESTSVEESTETVEETVETTEESVETEEESVETEESTEEAEEAEEVGIIAVDKEMYTTANVNLRERPTVESDSKGIVPMNTLIHVIGETEDGEWSKIEDDRSSESLYIKSSLLSEQPTEVKTADNEKASTDNGAVAPKTEAPSTPVVPENPVQTPDVDGNTPQVGDKSSATLADGSTITETYMGSSADRMSQGLGF